MILSRSHLHVTNIIQEGDDAIPLGGDDWLAVCVRLHGKNILLGVCYMTCNQGLTGDNLTRLIQFDALCRALGWDYLLGGDFNMLPHDLEQWFATPGANAKPLVADDVDGTNLISGRMIDFYIASLPLADHLVERTKADLTTPWGTHCGVHLCMKTEPQQH